MVSLRTPGTGTYGDVVIYFEGDKNHYFRLLRGIKNRLDPNEIVLMEMRSEGFVEVLDPADLLLGSGNAVGTAITSSYE